MGKMEKWERIATFLKLFTYIATSIVVLVNNNIIHHKVAVTLIAFLIVNSFFRQLYLCNRPDGSKYAKASLYMEVLLLIVLGSMVNDGAFIIYFFVTLTEANLSFDLRTSIPVALTGLFIPAAMLWGIGLRVPNRMDLINTFVSFGVSILFTFVMSYVARLQITEREKISRANRELEEAYKKLMENASQAQALSIERERTRMAREIHDTLAHTLTAAVVQMEACKKVLDADPARARGEIEKAQDITREGLAEVKRTIKALRPQVLENNSLLEAIGQLMSDTQKNTGVTVELEKELPEGLKLPTHREVALFRAVQESITNSIRHGAAGRIRIGMRIGTRIDGNRIAEEETLEITISDDGRGCPVIKKGYGLLGIAERVEGIQGTVSFASPGGKGFLTVIRVPLKGVVANEDTGHDRR